jgi:hypothetical protein
LINIQEIVINKLGKRYSQNDVEISIFISRKPLKRLQAAARSRLNSFCLLCPSLRDTNCWKIFTEWREIKLLSIANYLSYDDDTPVIIVNNFQDKRFFIN